MPMLWITFHRNPTKVQTECDLDIGLLVCLKSHMILLDHNNLVSCHLLLAGLGDCWEVRVVHATSGWWDRRLHVAVAYLTVRMHVHTHTYICRTCLENHGSATVTGLRVLLQLTGLIVWLGCAAFDL